MTLIIAILMVAALVLIAFSPLTSVNKAAVAMFAGTLGWVLYVCFGSDFVLAQHPADYLDFLSGTKANSIAVKEYIASNIFIRYVGKASEIVLFLIATMTIVEILDSNGCFDFIPQWIKTRHSRRLLWTTALLTLLISANLDNLTTTLMMLLLMHKILPDRRHRAVFGSVIVLSANIGGALTVIGDYNGLLLWNMGAVTPSHFSAWMALPCLVAWAVPTALMARKLPERVTLENMTLPYRGDDTNLTLWQRIALFFFSLGGLWFIPTFHDITKLSPFVGALCVLSLLWIVNEAFNHNLSHAGDMIQRRKPRALQHGILQSILFVTGIMLVMGVLVETGAGISRTKGLAYLIDTSDEGCLTAFDKLRDELQKYSEDLVEKPFVIIGTKIDEEGGEERFRLLKEKYSSETVLPLSIYMDELLEDVKKAFMKLADLDETKKDDDGGFTSRMDKDAVYRDEE